MDSIIKFSLNNKLFVFIGALLIALVGLYVVEESDVDVFPDLTAPTVVIMTDTRGIAAEEVERLITFPIEVAVNGATNVRRLRSSSLPGYSFVWVEFDWGTDIFRARQVVGEKIAIASRSLPLGVTPIMAPQSSVMGEILFVGLQADTTSMMQLRILADWVIKPAILATGGVSQVTILGGDSKQYQILADPQKMSFYGVTLDELAEVGKTFSDNSAGGVVRDFGNEFILRGIARTADLKELGDTYIKTRNNKPVLVSDVAEVVIGSAIKMGYASQNETPAIILSISKQPNVNTLKVTQNIEKTLDELQNSLSKDIKISTKIFRQADFIEASVENVGRALLEGAVLVIIILFFFLGSFRTTIISIIAIPLSLLGTMIVLYALDMNINTMTLGGMCIAIGSLVDDAIIDVENVYKRLRQNYCKPESEKISTFEIVFTASKEIRASILNATLIIIVAFVPLFFLSGMEGKMLKPLGIAYIVSLFISLIIAMTITPLLCKSILSGDKYLAKSQRETWVTRKLCSIYQKSLSWAINNNKKILIPTISFFALSVVVLTQMGQSFLPEFNEGSLVLSIVMKPGISLDESHKSGNLLEHELLKVKGVTSTTRRTGRDELDEHSQAINSSEIDVNFTLEEGQSKDDFLDEIRKTLSNIPGIIYTVGQPLGHRIDHMLSGTRANIAIKVFGTELSQLYTTANEIKNSITNIEGLVDVSVEQIIEVPQLQIRANRHMLAFYGISMERFNRFIEQAFSGEKLSDIYEGQRRFDLVLRLNKNYTENIEQVKNTLIDTENGGKVPLEQVADIKSVGGVNSVSRENIRRKIVVSANVAKRDLKSVVDDIKSNINRDIKLPEGYGIEYAGQFESAQKASRILTATSIAALVVIFLLLYGEFKNSSLSLIVLLNLPLALIGGVFALYFSSDIISIPSIIGFITLFGIATRNGILLISKYQHLEKTGTPLLETIMSGSIDRLNPILMTALTAALALIPLVFNGDKAGNEIQSPMAVVVLGGLLTSTLLNIYVVPVVYKIFRGRKKIAQ